MYPFRLVAADPINGPSPQQRMTALSGLGGLELVTLGPVALLTLAILVLRQRRALGIDLTVVAAAVLVVAAYDVVSIAAGGAYWSHYLVQLVVPTALAMGIVANSLPMLGECLAVAVVAASLFLWSGGMVAHTSPKAGPAIGTAIAKVSQPGDTMISAFGDADIVAASSLRSDYPYLWSLPARSLDKNFAVMASQLRGPDAPTWVVRGPNTRKMLLARAPGAELRRRYHLVAQLCGRSVYLRDSANRQPPSPPSHC
jgi:hypothetical protein